MRLAQTETLWYLGCCYTNPMPREFRVCAGIDHTRPLAGRARCLPRRASPLALRLLARPSHPPAVRPRQDAGRDCRLSDVFALERLPHRSCVSSWLARPRLGRGWVGRATHSDHGAAALAAAFDPGFAQEAALLLWLVPDAV